MASVDCKRCGEQKEALEKAPLPGDDGDLILSAVCADCWQEWTEEEVRTINELRLNFMDPEAQKTLKERMLVYLGLAEPEAGDGDPLCERTAESDASESAAIDGEAP